MTAAGLADHEGLDKPPIRAGKVAALSGFPVRTIQELSAKGGIPTARKLGKVWVYDEDAVKAWIRRGDPQCRQPTTKIYFKGVTYGGDASALGAKSIDLAYEHALRPKRVAAGTNGSRR